MEPKEEAKQMFPPTDKTEKRHPGDWCWTFDTPATDVNADDIGRRSDTRAVGEQRAEPTIVAFEHTNVGKVVSADEAKAEIKAFVDKAKADGVAVVGYGASFGNWPEPRPVDDTDDVDDRRYVDLS